MPKRGTPAIIAAALAFRRRIVRGDIEPRKEILRVYLDAYDRIRPELRLVNEAIESQKSSGKTPAAALVFARARLERVIATIVSEITRASATAATIVTKRQESLARQAAVDAKVLSALALDPTLPFPPPAEAIGATWTNINKPAVQALIGHAGDGSPLNEVLKEVAGDAAERARDMLVSHFTQGETPTDIGRKMSDVFGTTTARAQTIARTETMRAYRTSTVEIFREENVIKAWRWVAQMSYSTCIACIMMDGQEFSLDDDMDSHPNCRCVQIPITKTFAELGFSGAQENDTSFQSGRDWFMEQPADVQRKILGAGKYDAWKEGKVELQDLVAHSHSDKWGGQYHAASLKEALRSAKS